MNKSYVWLLLAFARVAVGCNTMEGFGKDVSKLGLARCYTGLPRNTTISAPLDCARLS